MPGAYVRQEYRERSSEPIHTRLRRGATQTICKAFWESCDLWPSTHPIPDKANSAESHAIKIPRRNLPGRPIQCLSLVLLDRKSDPARNQSKLLDRYSCAPLLARKFQFKTYDRLVKTLNRRLRWQAETQNFCDWRSIVARKPAQSRVHR